MASFWRIFRSFCCNGQKLLRMINPTGPRLKTLLLLLSRIKNNVLGKLRVMETICRVPVSMFNRCLIRFMFVFLENWNSSHKYKKNNKRNVMSIRCKSIPDFRPLKLFYLWIHVLLQLRIVKIDFLFSSDESDTSKNLPFNLINP